MFKRANIFRILRLAAVLLPLLFVLAACTGEDGPVNASNKTDVELAEEHTKATSAGSTKKETNGTAGVGRTKS